MTGADDWRLQGHEPWLAGRTLRWSVWSTSKPDWDHDHCSFCWAEISDQPVGDHVQFNAAWVTADDHYSWVCPDCFLDFREAFGWGIERDPDRP